MEKQGPSYENLAQLCRNLVQLEERPAFIHLTQTLEEQGQNGRAKEFTLVSHAVNNLKRSLEDSIEKRKPSLLAAVAGYQDWGVDPSATPEREARNIFMASLSRQHTNGSALASASRTFAEALQAVDDATRRKYQPLQAHYDAISAMASALLEKAKESAPEPPGPIGQSR